MTSLAVALPLERVGFPLWGTDRGATKESQEIPRRVTAVAENLLEAASNCVVSAGRVALKEAVAECSTPDWDGYDALPAKLESASWAERVAAAFPWGLGVPHFSFDPEGDALLEWFFGKNRVLTVIVSSTGELSYAARINGAKVTGIEVFADALPPRLAETARRLAP